jgi:hypothetical protein
MEIQGVRKEKRRVEREKLTNITIFSLLLMKIENYFCHPMSYSRALRNDQNTLPWLKSRM